MATILIVDDEKNIRSTLGRSLRLEGYATLEAQDGVEALALLASEDVDLMLLDVQMPLLDGLQVLEQVAVRGLRVPVIMLSAHGTVERAVAAIRGGAFDFVEKPPSLERLLVSIGNALRLDALAEENRRLREETGRVAGLLGDSPAMQELKRTIAQVAPTTATVLLLGENGTGKELVARAIQTGSARSQKPLVTVNGAAVPETLFESELFGHARGSFTGATSARRGKFLLAHGGTLFLDEVGEIPLHVQPKLLRALESGEVERVGGESTDKVDVRVIAATNRDLPAEVEAGRFRRDLYFRLNVVPVTLPPLRARKSDIPLLATHFLAAACTRHGLRSKTLTAEALDTLSRYNWPGNVRELRNAMERVAILSAGEHIDASVVKALTQSGVSSSGAAAHTTPDGAFDLAAVVLDYERELVRDVLERNDWAMTRAAEEMNLERSHLYKKLKALGLERG